MTAAVEIAVWLRVSIVLVRTLRQDHPFHAHVGRTGIVVLTLRSAVDGHLMAHSGHSGADLLDSGLEAGVPSGDTASPDHRNVHN